jgi:hypothetical protein
MDAGCYEAKVAALVQVRMSALKSRGVEAKEAVVAMNYYKKAELKAAGVVEIHGKTMVTAKEAKTLPKDHVQACVMREGREAGKEVWVLTKTGMAAAAAATAANPKSETRNTNGGSERQAAMADAAKLEEAVGQDRRIREAMLKAILESPNRHTTLRFLSLAVWMMMSHEEQENLAVHYGWVGRSGSELDAVVGKALREDADNTLAWELLARMAVLSLPGPTRYSPEVSSVVHAAARMVCVDKEIWKGKKDKSKPDAAEAA